MKLAVISDLHLGCGDPADSFGHRDVEFLKFLTFLENEFERIVLLGDIWETQTGPSLGRPEEELRRCRAAHPEIAARFQRKSKYFYVHGNHDIVAATAEAVPEELTLEEGGVRLLFTHGHHHDLLLARAFWISEFANFTGGWLRRWGLRSLYQLGVLLDDWRCGARLDPRSCTFQRWAMDVAATRAADIVVTGHTHIPGRHEHGSRLFLNSGSCAGGRTQFLALDTRRGRYDVFSSW